MENITEKINTLLQDPETMAQIQSLASMFGTTSTTDTSAPPTTRADPAPQSAVPVAATPAVPTNDMLSPEMMSMVMKLAPMLSNLRRETPNTQFLHALRPLLSNPRQKKLDEAVKLMQLMSLLPTLRQSGLLSQLL